MWARKFVILRFEILDTYGANFEKVSLFSKGVELELVRGEGERIILACAPKIPPLSDFPPPAHNLAPLWAYFFNFISFYIALYR